ncbi:MAG: NUDIX domain-containing protein [Hyphomicrobium sp.]|nr:NUDIX domain-containing protein [Hyphomicrobium sp.]
MPVAKPVAKLVTRGLQRYWRVSRGLTLGAQGCVLDASNRVLLIRHTYRPGWHFPGGGVEKNESAGCALRRELEEEAGILVDGRPTLFGLYDNHRLFRGDHIALFIVRSWRQPRVPPPNREIAGQGFFDAASLPDGINQPTQLRINEILEGSAPAEMW